MRNPNTRISRRNFVRAGAAALATASVVTSLPVSAQQPASELESEYLMELLLDGDPQIDTGHTRIAPLSGGSFSGPGLRGTVLPGGADWITQVDGHSSLDVRITLLTDDGAYIYMTYKGMLVRSDSGLYWRVTPVFNTASEKYGWLNHLVAVGKNKNVEGKIAYDIWRIL
ncbi:MAG: DUF3237 domain-containing protein [Pseudomonadales bacterium]|nr:DUF3237 domain-containing protein [Pseudomonadales bacterium]